MPIPKLSLHKETLRRLEADSAYGVQAGNGGGTGTDRPKLTITVCDGDTCSAMISVWKNLCG